MGLMYVKGVNVFLYICDCGACVPQASAHRLTCVFVGSLCEISLPSWGFTPLPGGEVTHRSTPQCSRASKQEEVVVGRGGFSSSPGYHPSHAHLQREESIACEALDLCLERGLRTTLSRMALRMHGLLLAICASLALVLAANAQEISQIDCNGRGTLTNGSCKCLNAQPSASNTIGYVGVNCEIPVTYFAKDTSRCERECVTHTCMNLCVRRNDSFFIYEILASREHAGYTIKVHHRDNTNNTAYCLASTD